MLKFNISFHSLLFSSSTILSACSPHSFILKNQWDSSKIFYVCSLLWSVLSSLIQQTQVSHLFSSRTFYINNRTVHPPVSLSVIPNLCTKVQGLLFPIFSNWYHLIVVFGFVQWFLLRMVRLHEVFILKYQKSKTGLKKLFLEIKVSNQMSHRAQAVADSPPHQHHSSAHSWHETVMGTLRAQLTLQTCPAYSIGFLHFPLTFF